MLFLVCILFVMIERLSKLKYLLCVDNIEPTLCKDLPQRPFSQTFPE